MTSFSLEGAPESPGPATMRGMQRFLSAYEARRAAQLAGIPERTLYDWAAKGVVVPSVAQDRGHMRWSYSDLLTLRLVDWLRDEKQLVKEDMVQVFRPTPMGKVREMLHAVEMMGGDTKGASVEVDAKGTVVLTIAGERHAPLAFGGLQGMVPMTLDLLAPYAGRGPDLSEPKEHVRIIPGTLSGQPHVLYKRVPTDMVVDLDEQGFSYDMIRKAYPSLTDEDIQDAVEFERELLPAA